MKRAAVVIAGLMVLAVISWFAWPLSMQGGLVNRVTRQGVQLGMTEQEVKAVLGEPKSAEKYNMIHVFLYINTYGFA